MKPERTKAWEDALGLPDSDAREAARKARDATLSDNSARDLRNEKLDHWWHKHAVKAVKFHAAWDNNAEMKCPHCGETLTYRDWVCGECCTTEGDTP